METSTLGLQSLPGFPLLFFSPSISESILTDDTSRAEHDRKTVLNKQKVIRNAPKNFWKHPFDLLDTAREQDDFEPIDNDPSPFQSIHYRFLSASICRLFYKTFDREMSDSLLQRLDILAGTDDIIEKALSFESILDFVSLFYRFRFLGRPRLGLTSAGHLDAFWQFDGDSCLDLIFHGDGQVRFAMILPDDYKKNSLEENAGNASLETFSARLLEKTAWPTA